MPAHQDGMSNMAPSAETARERARRADGTFGEQMRGEADNFTAPTAAAPVPVESFVQDEQFTEFGEYGLIADGPTERGIVGNHTVLTADGHEVNAVSQVAISEDEDGRWWNIYRDTQTVTTPDGRTLFREVDAGNIDSRTWDTEEEAWAALQDARASLTFDQQAADGRFDVLDEDWYSEVAGTPTSPGDEGFIDWEAILTPAN